jgi:hypothetical protein
MTIKHVITDGEKPVKVWTDELDPRSRQQLVNISKLPFIGSVIDLYLPSTELLAQTHTD